MVARNYRKQVNDAMTKQAQSLERSSSGLAFSKLSDNVASGSRAMYIQEQRYAATQQLNNVKDLMAEQKSIDSNLNSIHSILKTIQERMLKGMSEDWGESSRKVIAQEIGEKMEQLLQFANAQYAGHTLFGGTNNSVNPFTVNERTGKLQYNGIDVDQIFKSAKDGKYYYYPGNEDPDHPGNYEYTITGSKNGAGTIGGTDFDEITIYGDGDSFHLEGGANALWYAEIDGNKYYKINGRFIDENGKEFKPNAAQTGFDQVVIDGVTYVKDTDPNGKGYYYEAGVDPSNPRSIVGKVFQSDDGLSFTEMEVGLIDGTDEHLPEFEVKGIKVGGTVKVFTYPTNDDMTMEPREFKLRDGGGYDQIFVEGNYFVKCGTDENGMLLYKSLDPTEDTMLTSADGLKFTVLKADPNSGLVEGDEFVFTEPQKVVGERREVPNSGNTYADIGLGLRMVNSNADPRTAYQTNFSGLSFMGFAGLSWDGTTFPDPLIGEKSGLEIPGNIYDLLAKVKDALYPDFNKNALDDYYTQLVNLTDEVGMVRTDLGNRMQYLELTETRLDEDIYNMTTLETDLISSDPAEEAIKMKEVEYVWLALMQLGSKVLPASLLDFMS